MTKEQFSNHFFHLLSPSMGHGWPGVYKLWLLGIGHRALRRALLALNLCSRLDLRELDVVLFRDRHVLPGLLILCTEVLEVRGVDGFETTRATRVIARIGFQCVRLGTNDGTVLGERKDVWPGHPDRVEVSVQIEIVGQRGLRMPLVSPGLFRADWIRTGLKGRWSGMSLCLS